MVPEIDGGAGGLEVQVTIQDHRKWDGKGLPPEAVEKSGTPLPSTSSRPPAPPSISGTTPVRLKLDSFGICQ